MSDKLTIGKVIFSNERVQVVKAIDRPLNFTSDEYRRHDLKTLKMLMVKYREAARRFAKELSLTNASE